ncbi:MAG: hypothetical protein JXA18_10400 [Chitinispirillaceae bacterium]|nr:hypothetical protein [Chitinispirillaceae bacterium]
MYLPGKHELFTLNGAFIVIAAVLGSLTSCTPSPFGFTLSGHYTRDRFSGRDIGGHSIGVCPLLNAGGPVPGTKLPSTAMIAALRKKRPDLRLQGADDVHAALSSMLPAVALERYYRLLFNGEVVALQSADSLWKAVGADYLLVVRLRYGMDIRTFNHRSRKRIGLEAELWDCAAMETAWRISMLGTCNRAGISDQRFLVEAFGEIAAALPATAPSYDTKSW